ncbi:uncharacterized protein LOC130744695 [Lotus japonicus]|uniref:uncharacterized protein LOC130744695 n=1 Tax=Lotus japonicus TaxID=34305 RepID=UPI002585F7D3|nr:uncharacterized protein LOC130744695 [Lotus japonicus]
MQYAGASDPLYCRCFPMSLGKRPMNWFQNLPSNSLHDWNGVVTCFLAQYSSVHSIPKTAQTLALVKQKEKEPLKAFLNRFNKEADDITGLLPDTRLVLATAALAPGPFLTSLDGKPANTLEEFLARAEKFINMQDAATLRAASQTLAIKGPQKMKEHKDQPSTRESRRKGQDERKPKRKKYDSYTPLNSSLSRILREKASADLRDRPPPLLTRGDKLDSKRFCEFHDSPGHNTDECLNLKDKVEELIRAGRLSRYVAVSTGALPRPRSPPPRRTPTPPRHRGRTPPKRRSAERRDRTPPRRQSPERRRSLERRGRSRERRRSPDRHGRDEVRRQHGSNIVDVGSIAGGWAAGGPTNNSRKRSTRVIMSAAGRPRPGSLHPPRQKVAITFTEDDYGEDTGEEDDPIVIEALIGNGKIRRTLIDTGSSADIMFYDAYKSLGLSVKDLLPYDHDLVGFTGDRVLPLGYFDTCLSLGDHRICRNIKARFLVVECPTAYNAILGRPSLNTFRAIISTHHLMLKYPWAGRAVPVRGNLEMARSCYNSSCRLAREERKRKKSKAHDQHDNCHVHHTSILTDLDPRVDPSRDDQRLKPDGESHPIQVGPLPENTTNLARGLPRDLSKRMEKLLLSNGKLFAWSSADMPGIDPPFCSHRLSVDRKYKPVAQKKRQMSAEKQQVIRQQTTELLQAGIIREVKYTTWLSNVVLVKKANGKWHMCVDYTDLNKACPKDPFPLPSIDALVDNSSGYEYLSLMDAYSGYNQIPMHRDDEEKTAFITDRGTYCYTMLPFGLKNAVATYQRMMTRIFGDLMGKSVEVYIDDIIVKTPKGGDHAADLAVVFEQLKKHNMRLNPDKCTFGVRSGKFLGYMLTNRGIELNPDKCQAIMNMKSPRTVKEVQQLAGRMAAIGRFLPKAALRALPLYTLLKKGATFEWSAEADAAFTQLKEILSSPLFWLALSQGRLYTYT